MKQVVLVLADTDIQISENEEFKELINACDMEIVYTIQQTIKKISFRTYIGSGKCEEIRDIVEDKKIDYIVFNQDLSPLQIRNLEEVIGVNVMDRSELILAIFESRATTSVARLQIESAHLKKLLPRLIGANVQLGRQSGSGKNKGVGEKQLEIDRRRVKARIHEVERILKEVEATRSTQRRAREKSTLPLVSLVGYTNAGKSTIMNMLLSYCEQDEDKKVLEKDMLFATLDTSIRSIELPFGKSFLLSDTVGFVSRLPHDLVSAFHSTLEEVKYASLLLQVVDAHDSEYEKHMRVTQETLKQIGASHIPMIILFNKCDKTEFTYPKIQDNRMYMSAKESDNIPALLEFIHQTLHNDEVHCKLVLPYAQTSIYSKLMNNAHVLHRSDEEDGIHVEVTLSKIDYEKYKQYSQ
ncbi:MAG: GTPase HflX [Longicatena sp.]